MSKRMRMRRAAAMTGVAGLLAAAGVTAGAGNAVAADDLKLSGYDVVAGPGSMPRFFPIVESGTTLWGKVVVTVGTKPMTDPAGAGAGLPNGYVARANSCTQAAGYTGVFVCETPMAGEPDAVVPADAIDTTLYWGFAYMPANGDLAAAVKEARSAGSLPAAGSRGTAKVTVKSAVSAALNTVAFDTPPVPDGGTARHQLRVHAADAGTLALRLAKAEGQLTRVTPKIRLGNPTPDAGAECTVPEPELNTGSPGANLLCKLEPGDHVIGYQLTSEPGQYAQKYVAYTHYDLYTAVTPPEAFVRQTSAPFTVQGAPVLPFHGLHARDTTGRVWGYNGTRNAIAPFRARHEIGPGWQTYNALTSLSPGKQGNYYWSEKKPSAVTRGLGDVIARDASGTLWYYDRQLVRGNPFAPRVRVGTGWNIYDRLDGAGDLDRDGYVDLLARDKAGVLWLYKGTGRLVDGNRFKTRVKVGAGWGAYDRLAGGDDLNGDGRADLLARDKAGVLWLYKGTGSGTTPYATRTRVGAGWGGYDQLVVTGDLTDDGRADAVARDRAGVLWLYKGTGSGTTPFTTRTRVGAGWGTYNRLF
ncbi:FG-GAP repeat domain-containing protein [Streptomyces sp. NRRL F-5727]|uniref:FG-GAP repeat domain-containing protein n=1 Tax=Streptomyces sp. NRRL F-5727 TaxID=1463871 RepID=UPI00131A8D0B|nr:VCBS repeat-containing protein [Streptomyces sp. NRRL F-5727]